MPIFESTHNCTLPLASFSLPTAAFVLQRWRIVYLHDISWGGKAWVRVYVAPLLDNFSPCIPATHGPESDTPSPVLRGQISDTPSPVLRGQKSDTPSPILRGQISDTPSPVLRGQISDTPSPILRGQVQISHL